MRRLWIALTILAVILSSTLFHTRFLHGFTEQLTGLLLQAETQADQEHWEEALTLTKQAQDLWSQRDFYLHSLLRHTDVDSIHAGFQETLALLDSGEYGEYTAANARLITQLGLLYEAEKLTLKNIC